MSTGNELHYMQRSEEAVPAPRDHNSYTCGKSKPGLGAGCICTVYRRQTNSPVVAAGRQQEGKGRACTRLRTSFLEERQIHKLLCYGPDVDRHGADPPSLEADEQCGLLGSLAEESSGRNECSCCVGC